ncbi:MAG TPA: RNA polymerase sigma factor [Gaiellaceae bacterium]|nr:RNA polymerase sigma factor [Gaiellaceae bacterium]
MSDGTGDPRSDAELLRRSRRDPDAYVVLCRRHAAALQGWLRKELRDETLAQEILAETLAAAWFASKRFDDRGEGAGPWLHGIARNLVLRLRRDGAIESRARARLGLPLPEADGAERVLDRLAAEQELERLSEPLDGLPDEQKEALQLRVVESLDYAEVADRLRISPEAARARVFRALNTLRPQIGERR